MNERHSVPGQLTVVVVVRCGQWVLLSRYGSVVSWEPLAGLVEDPTRARLEARLILMQITGIDVPEAELSRVGDLDVHYGRRSNPPFRHETIFLATRSRLDGEVRSPRLAARWHGISALRATPMPRSASIWLPRVLEGFAIKGSVTLSHDGRHLVEAGLHELFPASRLEELLRAENPAGS